MDEAEAEWPGIGSNFALSPDKEEEVFEKTLVFCDCRARPPPIRLPRLSGPMASSSLCALSASADLTDAAASPDVSGAPSPSVLSLKGLPGFLPRLFCATGDSSPPPACVIGETSSFFFIPSKPCKPMTPAMYRKSFKDFSAILTSLIFHRLYNIQLSMYV
jgi:hypothetical protein